MLLEYKRANKHANISENSTVPKVADVTDRMQYEWPSLEETDAFVFHPIIAGGSGCGRNSP